MKKKFNVITAMILVCLIVASSISLGKVFAYFGAKSSASGAITMGTLSISDVKTTDGASIDWNIPNLQPNQSFGGSYKVDINSNINYYIRVLFKASVTPQEAKTHINGSSCGDYVEDDTDILSISIDGATTDTYQKSTTKTNSGYTAYYKLSPTTVTASSTPTTTTETFNVDLKINDWVGCNYCHYYMQANVAVNMRVQVMQADYLEGNNIEGGTISSASTMHSLWSTILNEPIYYNVSISNTLTGSTTAYGFSTTAYYAIDNETSWHAIVAGETINTQAQQAILFSMNNSTSPDWNFVTTTADHVDTLVISVRGLGRLLEALNSDYYYCTRGSLIVEDTSFEIYLENEPNL